ncbi:MAG TPA: alpha/beta hydrolase [Xanthobacteraceae bacterium]|jgi:arylformamidase|nr:alpha/beta hydrolase [Xanthobacteraceae bacterium]
MEQRTAPPILYRGMDRAALDAAYNNSAAVADSQEWVARWRARSAEIRAEPTARLDIVYGARPRAKLDYFPAGRAGAPLFVFIHGGYWQRNDKDGFAFVADGPRPHGIDVALVGYTLGPQARIADIVGEMRAALTFLAAKAGDFGFDAARIFVGGWSAGGHLTAAVCDHPAFCGGLPISGIFDLEPIMLNYLNEKLALDAAEVKAMSPLRTLPKPGGPLHVSVGGAELPELQRQSRDYAAAAQTRGQSVRLSVLAGHHHFSIMDELARPDGALVGQLRELVASTNGIK